MLILSILQLYYKYITNILLAAAIRREPLEAVQRKSLLRSLRRRRITRAGLLVGELRVSIKGVPLLKNTAGVTIENHQKIHTN
jgi:hypothetical protein